VKLSKILETNHFSNSDIEFSDILYLSIDTRKIINGSKTIFFTLDGARKKGAEYIENAYEKGVRCFVVNELDAVKQLPNATFYFVKNVQKALQQISIQKRVNNDIPSIGITGSNGKTIVKEWLFEILSSQKRVVKSPKSYNSQIGVPLSVWNIDNLYDYGVFEAGISKPGEMEHLEKIIKPQFGILTNIGTAHIQNFTDKVALLNEKLTLFENSNTLIYNSDDTFINERILLFFKNNHSIKLFNWGFNASAHLKFEIIENKLFFDYKGEQICISIKHKDKSSIENLCHCIAMLFVLNENPNDYINAIENIRRVEMRLEVIEGNSGNRIINDTYNSDPTSLSEALDFLEQQAGGTKKIAILTEMYESFSNQENANQTILELLKSKDLDFIFFIGKTFQLSKNEFNSNLKECLFFDNPKDFIDENFHKTITNATILFKGSRVFELDKIVKEFQQQTHETHLEINLNAIKNNLNVFAKKLKPETKIMIMLKAFGYGLGSIELAKLLEYQKIDYFAVAYLDEGIAIRNLGIKTPIMVLNTNWNAIDKLIEYDLEPEVYSIESFEACKNYISTLPENKKSLKIHLKIETGMNRLGLNLEEALFICNEIKKFEKITISSVFSHLAASDNLNLKDFTLGQINTFEKIYIEIVNQIGYKPLRHLLNSEGISNFSEFQYEMVRLGIGLFGINSKDSISKHLLNPIRLVGKISQIKKVGPKDTIGYNRMGKIDTESYIAIINIGYADGYRRSWGNGNASVFINEKKYPTIGNVCMDMTMIYLGKEHDIHLNDEVEVIGEHISIIDLAESAHTIPYEILTSIGSRVKRIYFES
jgi:alanine racemase